MKDKDIILKELRVLSESDSLSNSNLTTVSLKPGISHCWEINNFKDCGALYSEKVESFNSAVDIVSSLFNTPVESTSDKLSVFKNDLNTEQPVYLHYFKHKIN